MGWFSRNKTDDNTPINVMNDSWSMYFKWMGDNEEYPVMMFFDETYAEDIPDDYNEGVELMILFKPGLYSENGFPLPEVNSDLQRREDVMVAQIESARLHAKLVGRMVGTARKYYRFQCRDKSKLTELLQAWANEIPHLHRSEVKTEKGWGFYERILPRLGERMQMSDRNVIETLFANGAKEDTPYLLDFTFTGPTDKLDIIQKDLEEENFITAARESNRLHLQRELPLDLQTIYQCTSYMLMSSMAHDCKYEGWGCKLN